MKDWRIQPGIALVEIKGIYLLVSDQHARKYCPYILRINEIGAFIFRQMEEQKDIHEIQEFLKKQYDIPEDCDLNQDISHFINLLSDKKCLIQEETE